jgi:hypothetical protein
VSLNDGGPGSGFSEELASMYQPAPGSPEARRLAEVRSAEQLRHPDRPASASPAGFGQDEHAGGEVGVVQPVVAGPGRGG